MSSAAKRRPIVGGNWKCNPASASKLPELIANINACDTSKCDVYVCPSPLHVALCSGKFTNGAHLTPQNCNFTGCARTRARWRSTRWRTWGSRCSSATWSAAASSACRRRRSRTRPRDEAGVHPREGLNCVFCIGEPLPIREKGSTSYRRVRQPAERHQGDARPVARGDRVRAGGGDRHRRHRAPEQAQETHAAIRKWIAKECGQAVADGIRIQYGGSAKPRTRPTSRRSPTSTASSSAAPRSSPSLPTSSAISAA